MNGHYRTPSLRLSAEVTTKPRGRPMQRQPFLRGVLLHDAPEDGGWEHRKRILYW
jgi:hypothetical protein